MAKRHGAEFWRGHLDAWHQSDLTQKAYCATNGLGEKAFYRWHRKDKEAIAAAKAPLTLVPTRLDAPVTVAGNILRLHSPGGWRIELPAGGVPWLVDLLRQLP
jgi:hypothetical protein